MNSGKWEQSNQERSLEQKDHHEALCLHHMELGNRKTIACTSLAAKMLAEEYSQEASGRY